MKRLGLFLPWLLALIATVGSLYFSEAFHMEPCKLCWYQRITVFPLVIILGIAAFRGAYRIIIYVLPLSIIGLGIAAYQTLMILFFSQTASCPECTLKAVSKHPVTFPLLSLCAFMTLNIALIWIYYKHKNSKKL
jgi:disulfide bond formation protein DsbB